MRLALSLSLLAILTPAALPAQVTPHERAIPKVATGGWGSGGVTWDIVRDGSRMHQNWFRGDNLPPNYILLEIGERIGKTASLAMSFQYTIVLDNSSITWSQMQADPTKNLSANAVKLFDKTLNLPADAGGSSPNNVHFWCKLDRPFPFTGPHLIVQKTWGVGATLAGTRKWDSVASNPTQNLIAGNTCGGALKNAHANGTWTSALTGAAPNGIALWFISSENVMFGPVPLPLDLGIIGLKGCELGVDPQFAIAVPTDASGNANLSIPIAVPTNDTVWWACQVMHTTASQGWATTNVATTILGQTGLMRQVRVDKRGTKGPDTWNLSGPVLLVRGR